MISSFREFLNFEWILNGKIFWNQLFLDFCLLNLITLKNSPSLAWYLTCKNVILISNLLLTVHAFCTRNICIKDRKPTDFDFYTYNILTFLFQKNRVCIKKVQHGEVYILYPLYFCTKRDRTIPTKKCIKSAPHLHQKGANWALGILLFLCFGADVDR